MTARTLTTTLAILLSAAPLAALQEAPAAAADTGAWRVYTGEGEDASLETLIALAGGAEVVFLGESHNDVVGHRLQSMIFGRLLDEARAGNGASLAGAIPLVLSLEMFERDVQYILDEYLAGIITEDQLKRSARPWAFYAQDYAPIVEAAKSAGLRVLAANAPRRYVNLVSRNGPEALLDLSEEAKRYLAPLPYAGPSVPYREELLAIQHGDSTASGAPGQENGFMAQSLWDATMAYSIADALVRNPDARLVHLVGSFHVKNGTGLPEQLERYRPGTRTLIVYVDPVDDVNAFPGKLKGAGHLVILTDKSKVRASQRTGSAGLD